MNAAAQPILNFGQYPQEFLQWLVENQHIWKRFEREANRLWNKGRRHYSSKTIIEFLRHETALYEQDSEWKINNNFSSSLSRYYIENYPDRSELFELRALKKERVQDLAA